MKMDKADQLNNVVKIKSGNGWGTKSTAISLKQHKWFGIRLFMKRIIIMLLKIKVER